MLRDAFVALRSNGSCLEAAEIMVYFVVVIFSGGRGW